MNDAAQERARGDHQRTTAEHAPIGEFKRRDRAILQKETAGFRLDHRKARRLPDQALHRRAIKLAIDLGARALHGGALAAVEDAKLDARGIRRHAHQPVERVDLAHQMAFAETADRRIAGHRADRVETLRHQSGRSAQTRGRRRGFAAGMPSANDDHVEPGHSPHRGCFAETGLASLHLN